MDIKETAAEIHQTARDKGFWDFERNVGELLMLVTSELGEALEAHRKGKHADISLYKSGLSATASSKGGEEAMKEEFEEHIKDTLEDELADAMIRIMDMAEGMGIDLAWHIRAKMEYNKTRERLHGKAY